MGFEKNNMTYNYPPYSKAPHIEAIVNIVQQILVDGRSSFNLCTYKLVRQLGYPMDVMVWTISA